jgi:Zn-dependent M28 family amino/carboxypeptidase
MRNTYLLAATCALVHATPQYGSGGLPPVSSESLQALISEDGLFSGSSQLQSFADANGGTRVFGSPGHNATVNFLFDVLDSTGYFDVTLQPFVALFSGGDASLTANGDDVPVELMTYTPNGSGSGPLVAVNNLGCNTTDFPPETAGAVALISRGTCPFATKAANAFTAGAIGAAIYNNAPGTLSGTLGGTGDYPPTVGMTTEAGEALLAQLEAGPVTAEILTNVVEENRTTYNVLAETKGGDHDNVLMLGGHTDSVEKGPGINDDGSGVIGILNVALALTNFSVTNAVRFGFWSAEEFGLLGSEAYLKEVNQSATELAKIRAYLNFDMIASPNYIYAIYDGDGSSFNLTGPAGSAEIEAVFEQFYISQGQNFTSTAFDGRSDYGPFLENGIAAGGLFTGAEQVKTAEEVEMFGGLVDVAYDENYHEAGDTIENLNMEAYLLNTKCIADSVAIYATSLDSIPPVAPGKVRRDPQASARKARRSMHSGHAHAGCNGKDKVRPAR